jgi:hypothetical protein
MSWNGFCWHPSVDPSRLRPVHLESMQGREAVSPPAIGRNPACPWLPAVSQIHDFTLTRRHGSDRGATFYQDALCYAQSLWVSGKPAQALLQLDKAWMADLPDGHPVLESNPPPYQALGWILQRSSSGHAGYLGNPVRHFQHLASRMSGPRSEIRSWRAWLCLHLAEQVLGPAGFPRDGRQIAREGLWIPSCQRALDELATQGWADEARHAGQVVRKEVWPE